MFRSLYLSRPWVSCFEGEGGAGDGAARCGDKRGCRCGGRRRRGAGAAAAAGETRFTQEDLNRFLAEDRRKHQIQLQKMESQAQRTGQEQEPDGAGAPDVEGEPGRHRRSVAHRREQQLTLEKRQLEEQYQAKVEEAEKKAQVWEALFRDSTIERSLQDAAVKHEAFNPRRSSRNCGPGRG